MPCPFLVPYAAEHGRPTTFVHCTLHAVPPPKLNVAITCTQCHFVECLSGRFIEAALCALDVKMLAWTNARSDASAKQPGAKARPSVTNARAFKVNLLSIVTCVLCHAFSSLLLCAAETTLLKSLKMCTSQMVKADTAVSAYSCAQQSFRKPLST